MKFAHLKETYDKLISEHLPQLESKLGRESPRLSKSRATAEETMASFLMANDDERYRPHLASALNHRIDWWQRGRDMGAWDFILYTSVGLALEDVRAVDRMLEMKVNEDGYVRVTIEWFRLHKAILAKKQYTPRPVKKNKGEECIFEELAKISKNIEPNWSGFDTYWKSTRNRTHEPTILQHSNLLKDGMRALWINRNTTEQGGAGNA